MKIAIINQSEADNAALPLLALSSEMFLKQFVADNDGDASRVEVHTFPTIAQAPDGWLRAFLQDHLDTPDAAAYHDRDEKGNPIIYVGFKNIPDGELFHGKAGDGASLAGELQHELAEAWIDPFCNLYADLTVIDPATGQFYRSLAVEAEDPVQETCDTFDVQGTKVDRTDYILPAYWNGLAPKGTKVDRLGVLTGPGTMAAGGYLIARKIIAKDGQLFGKCIKIEHRAPMAKWRADKKARAHSRTSRRLVQEVRLGSIE